MVRQPVRLVDRESDLLAPIAGERQHPGLPTPPQLLAREQNRRVVEKACPASVDFLAQQETPLSPAGRLC